MKNISIIFQNSLMKCFMHTFYGAFYGIIRVIEYSYLFRFQGSSSPYQNDCQRPKQIHFRKSTLRYESIERVDEINHINTYHSQNQHIPPNRVGRTNSYSDDTVSDIFKERVPQGHQPICSEWQANNNEPIVGFAHVPYSSKHLVESVKTLFQSHISEEKTRTILNETDDFKSDMDVALKHQSRLPVFMTNPLIGTADGYLTKLKQKFKLDLGYGYVHFIYM